MFPSFLLLIDTVFDFPPEDVRWGRYRITELDEDIGKYKTPSLRNLSSTAPYMHDGRFETLTDVLDHYNGKEVQNNLISLSASDQDDLLAFLITLNDESFISQ